jgi:hypothetical protein
MCETLMTICVEFEITLNTSLIVEHYFIVNKAYWKRTNVNDPFSYVNTVICSNRILLVFNR